MKRISIIIAVLSLAFLPQTYFAQSKKQQKLVIAELQHKIDSLQRSYDSLYAEHQDLLEPVSSGEGDIMESEFLTIDYNSDNIDSLLNLYYIQRQMDPNEVDFAAMDRDSLTSDIPDEVYIQRLKAMNSFIPMDFNRYVKNYLIRYTTLKSLPRIIALSKFYFPSIEQTFDEFGLPKELKALAVIESAFNPRAVSRANAKGMWQFMYTIAKYYGLEMDSYVDERYDPAASCRAAAQYLKDAYQIFGDWPLAIASYNCGAGNVSKAIRRSGGKTTFWEIYDYLPRETRGYVPAFIAALYAMQYYPEHGVVPAQLALPAHVDTFHINRNLHFNQISETLGIPIDQIRDLNPMYLHDIIPGNTHEYILNLPNTYSNQFIDREDEIYAYKDTVFFNPINVKKIEKGVSDEGQRVIHKVRSGETLGSIARRYHVTVNQIKNWNNLRTTNIRVGQRLVIQGKGGANTSKASSAASSSTHTPQAKTSASGYSTYTVRKGDTLYEIARKTGTTVNELYELNSLNKYSKIYPGMVIRIKQAK